VLDLTWAVSGPYTARHLADYGATVIHVESTRGPDSARAVQPFIDNLALPENAAIYHNMNAGKLSLSLNMASPGGREVLDDLVAWADVLIESFSPRGRLALGLDYERLRVINPRLVMMSTCLFGQQGPMAGYAGFGNMAACLVGFFDLTGWPDRGPAGPFGAYTDYISPRYAFVALASALRESRATGRGQYLDFAQAEAAVNFLSVAMLDYTVNGRVAARTGNDDPAMSPHGVYPCTGTDRWVAVACRDDSDWRALATVIGRPDLASLDTDERIARRAELNDVVAAWTRQHSPADAEAGLIAAGVPAHAVVHSPELYADPQLTHLGHFVDIPHPHHGSVTIEASRLGLSGTPSVIANGSPSFGLHTVDLLTETLGYDPDRVGELFSSGALD
jgi:benzylsuccinate CoA-transferase BbsF subunit